MSVAIRAIGLLVVTGTAVAASAYAQHLTAIALFQPSSPRPYSEMVTCAIIGALVAGGVSAFPLAWLFRRWAWLAGLFVSLPVLLLRVPEVVTYSGPLEREVKAMGVIEAASFLSIVVLAAAFVSRRWPRSDAQSRVPRVA